MNNIVAFIAPSVDDSVRQKLAELLRIRQIATTDNVQNATLIIADVEQPVEHMSIADFAERLVDNKIQEILKMKREILLFNQQPQKIKPDLNIRPPLKQFIQTKQIHKQRVFNRTNCK